MKDCYYCIKEKVEKPEKGFLAGYVDGIIVGVCYRHLQEYSKPQVTSEGRLEPAPLKE